MSQPSLSDFNSRLQAALEKAKAGVASAAAAAPVAVPHAVPEDEFTSRIASALNKASAPPVVPRGASYHPVQPGETLISIAAVVGQPPDRIWLHPLNAQLRERLHSRMALAPGDALYIPAPLTEPAPVGQGQYVVKAGDCMASIANQTGFFWETLWNDAGNSQLRDVRVNPNVLLRGDRVTIPELRRKDESIECEQRHRFKRRGEPSRFEVQLLEEGQPRANLPYTLTFDAFPPITGTTDANGNVQAPMPGDVHRAVLIVGNPGEEREYKFLLGKIEPVDATLGAQQRLRNLGYRTDLDGRLSPRTIAALKEFQHDNGLQESGEPDEATRAKLVELYGS